MAEMPDAKPCLHACQGECGRPYEIIIIQTVDSSTLLYCMPCFMAFAYTVMQAMTEADNPAVQEVVASNPIHDVAYVTADAAPMPVRGYSDPKAEDEFDFDGDDGE